ncbi:MAG: DMT family transporter [Sumerlaeia bacterium]
MPKISLPYLALMTMFITWGTGFVATKIVVNEIPPMLFNGMRYLLCGILLLGLSFARGVKLPRDKTVWSRIGISSGLSVFGGNFFLTIALLYINGGIAPVVTSLESSIFILMCFFWGERFGRSVWWGLIVGFCGLIVMFWPALQSMLAGSDEAGMANYSFALFFLLLTAFCWGIGGFYVRHYSIEADVFLHTGVQYMLSCGVFLVIAAIYESWDVTRYSTGAWAAFFYVSLITTILGYGSYMYILDKLPANVIATKAYALPLISIITGYLLLDEVLTTYQIAGAVVILFGIGLVNSGKKAKANG